MALVDEIKMEHLLPEWQKVAGIIGIDNFLKLTENYGGDYLYIPKTDSVITQYRKHYVKKFGTPYNRRNIAEHFKVSVRVIDRDKKS